MIEDLVGVEGTSIDHLHVGPVAACQMEVEIFQPIDQQDLFACDTELFQPGDKVFCFWRINVERAQHHQTTLGQTLRQDALEGVSASLLVDLLGVGPRPRTVSCSTRTPQRRLARTGASASGALLLPGLGSGAFDIRTLLGFVSSATAARQIGSNHFPHQVLIHLMGEDTVGEIDIADHLVVPVFNVNLHGPTHPLMRP